MSEMHAAGWYPDPQDNRSERWWGGTDWTANTRPLSQAPAQTPPPTLPAAAVALPPAGWYPDPQNAAGEMWFDGAAWTQATRPRPSRQYAGALGWSVGAAGQRRLRWDSKYKPLAALIGGLVLMALGLGMGLAFRTPANMSATTTGTVSLVEFSYSTGSKPQQKCSSVAVFAVGGQKYTATSSTRATPCPYSEGQQIDVAYDPASPADAQIPTQDVARFIPWFFALTGAPLLVGGLLHYVRSLARRARRG